MIMKRLIFIVFFIQSLFVLSQESKVYNVKEIEILNADSLNQGLYISYDEFIHNDPSITDVRFHDDKRFEWEIMFFNKKKEDLYIYDENGKKVKLKEKVWGFCNGESIYIYHKKRYCKVEKLGKYSVFIWKMEQAYFTQSSGSFNTAEKEFLMDISTGEIYKLSSKNLKKYVLNNEPELLEKFKNETLRNTMLYLYINKVNLKYMQ